VRLVVAFLVLAFAGSCSLLEGSKPRQSEWIATRPDAADLTAAKKNCESEALNKTENVRPSGLAAKAAGGTYIKCMADQGWELREAERDE
jgi:hypothetical protein